MKPLHISILAVSLWCVWSASAQTEPTIDQNLLPNPSLETAQVPEHWKFLNVWGAPGHFALDEQVAHSGKRSFRVSAKQSTQSWLYSDPIPVAAGETIEASAWVRYQDLPEGHTTGEGQQAGLILVANFFEGDGRSEHFQDFAHITAAGTTDDWQELKGSVKVPQEAATLRLRIGFRDTIGTCWIDDVSVRAKQKLVARADLSQPRLTPDLGGIPVAIINRDARKRAVTVRAKLGSATGSAAVTLTGEPLQKVLVPIALSERRELPLEITLLDDKQQKVFTEKRRVLVPLMMVLSPMIPTHWAIEDGAVRVTGDVDLALTKEQRDGAKLEVTLNDGSQDFLTTWTNSAPLDEGFNRFDLRAENVPVGEYVVHAALRKNGATIAEAKQPFVVIHREQSHVVLNQAGYLEYQGNAIFPLGIFNGPAKVKEMGEAGFTVNHAYNAANVEPGERPHDEEAMQFLNETGKNGMKALFLIPRGLAFSGDWEGFRRRIRMFKNHPALLAWDEEEGLARGDMDLKALATMRKIIREEDPYHPFMVGDSRDVITEVKDRANFFPLKLMDLGMWWWYPIPAGASRENMLEGDEFTKAMELTPPSFLTLRNTDKPLWVGIQSYAKPNKTGRYPTPDEYRAQAYISIIHGAKGLMWYGGSVDGGIYLDPKAAHWEDFKKLVRELRDRSDVFMSPNEVPPTAAPKEAPISLAVKRAKDKRVLLAVNRGTKEIDVTITASDGKQLRHHFKPYETYVEEWPTSPSSAGVSAPRQ
jgi:hypothetical protein